MTDVGQKTLGAILMTIGAAIFFAAAIFLAVLPAPANEVDEAPVSRTCSVELSAETQLEEIKSAGLVVVQYTGTRFEALMKEIINDFGPPPAEFDSLWAVYMQGERVLNIGFFKDGCLVTAVHGVSIEMWNNLYNRALKHST